MTTFNLGKARLKPTIYTKLLTYYFTNPDSNLYLREIATILKVDAGNLSKLLNRLENEGLFISQERGNQKYFSLNKDYPLYEETKSIIFKTVGIQGSLSKILSEVEGINTAFIYGSYAQKAETATSDIDLLIVGSPDEKILMKKIDNLEKSLNREINYAIYSKEEFDKKKKEDSFIIKILKRPKIILVGKP